MTRPYRKQRRADQEEATRLRITEAAVSLHATLGPARTTVSAVAERAGVQRATVYRHFPTDGDLFQACTTHWAARYPLPDPGPWTEIADPGERLRTALGELYVWYSQTHEMLERATRDAELVPAMRPAIERRLAYLDAARAVLMRGRRARGARRERIAAAIGHALSFATWRSLVGEQGLSQEDAIEVMAGAVGSL